MEPTVSTCKVRAGSAVADVVGAGTEQHHRNIYRGLGGQVLGRSTQPFISGSTHTTPQQLGNRSRVDRLWESSTTKAAQIPSGSTPTLIPEATVPRP